MDSLTAGTAVIATLLGLAVVMAGIYVASPKDKCVRYWFAAEVCIALGIMIILLNAGARRYPILVLGNNILVWGVILQWWGAQSFYGEKPGKAGWVVGLIFLAVQLSLFVIGTGMMPRVLLLSAVLFTMLTLSFHTIWHGTRGERSFGARMVLTAILVLMMNNLFRSVAGFMGMQDFEPMTRSSVGVAVMYLLPLLGSVVYATGLLVLYFERLVREKHFLATHDDLTGLLNRRAIIGAGEREVDIANRSRKPITVALVDIDFFKQINDRLGHAAGDAVLADVAQLLRNSVRHIDLTGRYGGEEFCIVFPGADHPAAMQLGQRLVSAARDYRFRHHNAVTISVGLVSCVGGEAECTWTQLVNRADIELYKAKAQGRDQFCLAESMEVPHTAHQLA